MASLRITILYYSNKIRSAVNKNMLKSLLIGGIGGGKANY